MHVTLSCVHCCTDPNARPYANAERNSPTADESSDRPSDTGSHSDTDARELASMFTSRIVANHDDLLVLRIPTVDCLVAGEKRRRSPVRDCPPLRIPAERFDPLRGTRTRAAASGTAPMDATPSGTVVGCWIGKAVAAHTTPGTRRPP